MCNSRQNVLAERFSLNNLSNYHLWTYPEMNSFKWSVICTPFSDLFLFSFFTFRSFTVLIKRIHTWQAVLKFATRCSGLSVWLNRYCVCIANSICLLNARYLDHQQPNFMLHACRRMRSRVRVKSCTDCRFVSHSDILVPCGWFFDVLSCCFSLTWSS